MQRILRQSKLALEVESLLTAVSGEWYYIEDWFQEVWEECEEQDDEGFWFHNLLKHRTLDVLKKVSTLHESELVEGMNQLFHYLYLRDFYRSPE